MSFRGKKVSAFAVFKGRKATSLSAVDRAVDTPITKAEGKIKKSASTSNTPLTSRDTSLSSSNSKVRNSEGKLSASEKKKQKADLKKVKKLLKATGSGKLASSFLPDSSVNTPLTGLKNGGGVELKSLRPKGSMANLKYSLPLRSDPGIPELPSTGQNKKTSPRLTRCQQDSSTEEREVTPPTTITVPPPFGTPPLPPRGMRPRANAMSNGPKQAQKRTVKTTDVVPVQMVSHIPRDEPDLIPPRPPKRRRISQGSPSTQKSMEALKDGLYSRTTDARERTEPLPSHPTEHDTGSTYMYDSLDEATRLFECLIHPVKPQKFFSELWEKKPLLVKRHMPNYNDGWISTADLDNILREERLMFTENIDVVTYTDGKRETHNPIGRAHAPIVWDYYQNGCSIRLLNPQTYCRPVWKLLSILQEYFGSCTGANVYLTPPGTQGFAPHWDDIEAFIVQLEGKKHWKLYSPRTENETLPRYSSSNFTDEDIGEPILDVILEAGDLLYFPRGTIHQGHTMEDAHSLHITVSCSQKNTWGDLLQTVVPRALDIALEEDVEFRKALPRDYLQYMGVAFSDIDNPERTAFLRRVEQLMMKLISHAPVDAGADQMGKKFLHDSLPPVLSEEEKKKTVFGNGERWNAADNQIHGATEIEPDTEIKIIRRGVLRIIAKSETDAKDRVVSEGEEKVCVYHNLENTRLYHEVEPQYIEVTPEMAPAIEHLLHTYPQYCTVDSLPLDTVQEKVELASTLYEKGLLMTETPLVPLSDTGSDSENETSV